MKMRFFLVLLLACSIRASDVLAQCEGGVGPDGLSWEFDTEEKKGFSLWGFIGETFTPRLVRQVNAMRAYVRDRRFAELMRLCGDMRAVDAIYLRALRLVEYEIGRALFLSMVATMEHRKLGIHLGPLGTMSMPLTFEEDSLFRARIQNLPARIYDDSPQDEHGDKDKLQHFFGSAYLAYVSSPDVARTAGDLIEKGEATFIVGGVDDPRDRRANRQGERFGTDLVYVKNLLPSDYLRLRVRED